MADSGEQDALHSMIYRLTIHGTPRPAGSKRGFPIRGKGGKIHVAITDASTKAKPWQAQVRAEAAALIAGRPLLRGALSVIVNFYLARPKSHFGKRGLRPSAPMYPTVKPDSTKLWRAVEDALEGVMYASDAQIVRQLVNKQYGEPERCELEITALEVPRGTPQKRL